MEIIARSRLRVSAEDYIHTSKDAVSTKTSIGVLFLEGTEGTPEPLFGRPSEVLRDTSLGVYNVYIVVRGE